MSDAGTPQPPTRLSSVAPEAIPGWYSTRYDEDGDTMWVPVYHKTWHFPVGNMRAMSEGIEAYTRGQARNVFASEMGVDFTSTRVRKVWMRQASGYDELGWTDDMAWECEPEDHEGALPFWRVDYAPKKVAS